MTLTQTTGWKSKLPYLFQELCECLTVLEAIFDHKKTVKADEVGLYSSILLAWALLLSVTPSRQAYILINK